MTARGFTAVPWPTGSSGTGQPVRSVRCLVSSTPARAAGPPMSRLVGIMAHARTEATADDPTGGPVQLRRPRRYRQGVYRSFLRPGWFVGHLLVLAAVLTCLRLGWWQWDRSQEATGSAQNLGYALLWPAFGAAFIYMWLRFLQLEVIKDVEEGRDAGYGDPRPDLVLLVADDPGGTPAPAGASPDSVGTDAPATPPDDSGGEPGDPDRAVQDTDVRPESRLRDRQRPSQGITVSVAMVDDEDPDDPELTAYNRALAALAEEDRRRAR